MQSQIVILSIMFLPVLCFIKGLENEVLIESSANKKEIILVTSNVAGTVSTYSALVGAVLFFCAISLTLLYFLVMELSEKSHDEDEVLNVINHYQLNEYGSGDILETSKPEQH